MPTQTESKEKKPVVEIEAFDFHISKGNAAPTIVRFDREKMLIGRMPQNQIVLEDASVSRTHALVRQSKGKFFVVDQGSQNGTLLNGRVILQDEFKPGDLLTIGTFTLKLAKRAKVPG